MLKVFAQGALFGELYGNHPPRVLALHGWGRDRSDFAQVLEGLDALSLDLPGFGASPTPSEPIGAAGYAAVVEKVGEEFAHPPVVVGHSFGGRVAVALAAARPQAVSSLVLTGAPLLRRSKGSTRPRMSAAYRLAKWANRRGILSDGRLEAARRRRGSADYRAATGVMREILVRVINESYEEELARLSCPVRLVWGSDDQEVPVSVAHQVAALLDDVDLQVVEGAGHHLPLTAPARLRHTIEGLL